MGLPAFWRLCTLALTLALPGAAWSAPTPTPRGLAETLGRPEVRAVLNETAVGRELAARILGHEPRHFDDLIRIQEWAEGLPSRAMPQSAVELQRRMDFLTEETRGLGFRTGELAPWQKAFLEVWARRTIRLRSGRFEFLPETPRTTTYGATRDRLIRFGHAEPPVDQAGNPLAWMVMPEDAWKGPLQQRLQKLAEAWPQNVRLVEDVQFTFENTTRTSRTVLVIATDGLSLEAHSRLIADYLRAVSWGSISFPLGEAGGHLYTRIGTHAVDFEREVRLRPYEHTGSRRLEAVLVLRPEEQARLLEYLNHARVAPFETVGPFSMDGIASGRTRGRIDDNRRGFLAEGYGHNCTSWVCTAPVGAQGEPLLGLAGARTAQEVHTNPGWWSQYLTGAAPAARVPVAVYFAGPETMGRALERIQPGRHFPHWNFNTR
jgi:hypothetical protein